MSGPVLFAADILVAILLVATIATSVRLSRRIAALKADEAAMRSTIGDLVAATERAERAVAGLKATAGDSERRLAATLRAADEASDLLAKGTAAGEAVMARIEAVIDVSRRAAEGGPPGSRRPDVRVDEASDALRAAIAAAQAITERAAARFGNRAA